MTIDNRNKWIKIKLSNKKIHILDRTIENMNNNRYICNIVNLNCNILLP